MRRTEVGLCSGCLRNRKVPVCRSRARENGRGGQARGWKRVGLEKAQAREGAGRLSDHLWQGALVSIPSPSLMDVLVSVFGCCSSVRLL